MRVLTWMGLALMVAVGSLAVWFGQVDDSPGLGGIGLILGGSAIFMAVRRLRRQRRR
jgi:hypothetical protein